MLNDVAGKTDYEAGMLAATHSAPPTTGCIDPPASTLPASDPAESDPRVLGREVLFGKLEYGEGQADDAALNLRARVFRSYDNAGIATSAAYDFKGNLLRGTRQLAIDYQRLCRIGLGMSSWRPKSSQAALPSMRSTGPSA